MWTLKTLEDELFSIICALKANMKKKFTLFLSEIHSWKITKIRTAGSINNWVL